MTFPVSLVVSIVSFVCLVLAATTALDTVSMATFGLPAAILALVLSITLVMNGRMSDRSVKSMLHDESSH